MFQTNIHPFPLVLKVEHDYDVSLGTSMCQNRVSYGIQNEVWYEISRNRWSVEMSVVGYNWDVVGYNWDESG